MKRSRILIAAVSACLSLAITADAYATFNISPAGRITMPSTREGWTFSTSLGSVVCNLTMNGSLEAGPIAETRGSRFGQITSTTFGCAGGWSFVQLTPAEMRFNFYLVNRELRKIGKLYTIEGYAVLMRMPEELGIYIECLYAGELNLLASVDSLGNVGTSTYLRGQNTLPLWNSNLNRNLLHSCPSELTYAGSSTWSPSQRLS